MLYDFFYGFPWILLSSVMFNVKMFFTFSTLSDVEWEVLYTKQITQKAKKYHDGFIQLKLCGSHGRQVNFYQYFYYMLFWAHNIPLNYYGDIFL